MRLLVSTPNSIVVDDDNVAYVRAEDATGVFGVLPGHANFITVLAISVITWRDTQGNEQHLAVRSGVLNVRNGNLIEVATRQAVTDPNLHELGEKVLETFRQEEKAEESSRISATRLQLATIKQLQRYFNPNRQSLTQNTSSMANALSDHGHNTGAG